MDIGGKVALVTGAATGIGRATALALAAHGARVAVADVDAANGAATVEAIRQAGGEATFVLADVSTVEGIRAMFDAVVTAYGGVDIVHNNAGLVSGEPMWPEMTLERIKLMIDVNLAGVCMSTAAAIPLLATRGGGVIVNTASTAALNPMLFQPIRYGSAARRPQAERAIRSLTRQQAINGILDALIDGGIHRQMVLDRQVIHIEQRHRAARDLFGTAERITIQRLEDGRSIERSRQTDR